MSRIDQSSDEQHPFERVSDVSRTRYDRVRNYLERHVYTPLTILVDDRRTLIGGTIVFLYLFMGFLAVTKLVSPPKMFAGPRLLMPFESMAFPLGTDAMGRGLLTMIIYATPTMLQMIFAGAVFATALATIVGTVAGYKGGLIDEVLTMFADIILTVPGLPLIIVLTAVISPKNPILIGVLLTTNVWAGLARTIRSEVLSVRDESYVEASRIMDVSTARIIKDDILPNIMPYVLINFMYAGRVVIFNAVGLYFLGLLPFTSLNWGVILNNAVSNGALTTFSTIHWVVVPALTIILLSYGLIMLSQGMDQLFNPRVRARKWE